MNPEQALQIFAAWEWVACDMRPGIWLRLIRAVGGIENQPELLEEEFRATGKACALKSE